MNVGRWVLGGGVWGGECVWVWRGGCEWEGGFGCGELGVGVMWEGVGNGFRLWSM